MAHVSSAEALIAHLKLTIEKMRRELYGQRSERKAQLLDQMELELEELKAAAAEDELAAAVATNDNTMVCAFTRKRPSRKLNCALRLAKPARFGCCCVAAKSR